MSLPIGTRLGPYEIVATIGAGSMGDVYRARDTRLDREVAIKVLPSAFSRDPDRLARFEREARAVAAINHPNILSVHDIGSAEIADAQGQATRATYMVTELLDGDTLRARLEKGPLPARKSVDIAMQVARGLAAAHDRGIVHRDLKPENIVLLRDGHVKILDFGLAKSSANEDVTMLATQAGTVMGTVGYMAPEQVRGETADARSDLFSLGVVLYELAGGERAFQRPTPAETMTSILHDDPPPWRPGLPPALDRIVRHALEKDPPSRFQSARDFAFALQAVNEATASGAEQTILAAPAASRRTRWREMAAWSLAALLAVAAVVLFLSNRATPAKAAPVVFAASLPGVDITLFSPAVSPDGQQVAFVARDAGTDSIWVRRLDAMRARPIKGTSGVRRGSIFWSPDSRSLGFMAGGMLKAIELTSEKIEQLADAPAGFGGAWGPDGTILYTPDGQSPIYRVSASGGEKKPVTTFDAAQGDESHRWPQFLPDGRHFVFMPWRSSTTVRTIHLASLDDRTTKPLFESSSSAVVAGNYLLAVEERPSRLTARRFDPTTLAVDARSVQLVADDNVEYEWDSGYANVTASGNTLIYRTGKFDSNQVTWFSRTGRSLGTLGNVDAHYDPAISPDGTALAVEKRDADRGSTDLWTVDLARGAFSRLTSTSGFESVSTWSPDGQRIAFGSDQGDSPKLLIKNANGTGAEEIAVDGRAYATDWSSDGKLLYMIQGGATRDDVWEYDMTTRKGTPVLVSTFNEGNAKFSPDGKWIAYVSDETQARQVYVRSFPDGGGKLQISTGGGNQPAWRKDGKELYYLAPDSTLMAVSVRPNGSQLAVEAPQPLFATRVDQTRVIRNHYAPASDGQRFVVIAPAGNPATSPFIGVLNWASGLP